MKKNYLSQKTNSIFISVFLLMTILLQGCGIAGPKPPGKYAETAQCLTEKGVILYGTYWCPYCKIQMEDFGDDSQFISYQECDDNGPKGDSKVCLDAGVTSFPTWYFPGQGNLIGRNPIFIVAKLANCQDTLPLDDLRQLKEIEDAIETSGKNIIEKIETDGESSSASSDGVTDK